MSGAFACLTGWRTRFGDAPIGIVCAVVVVVLFAGFSLVSRLALTTHAVRWHDLAMLRFAVAGALLLPILLGRGLGPLRWRQAALLVLAGGLGFALLAYTGFRLAPASHAGALLHGTIALFTFGLSWLVARPTPSRMQWGGVGLMVAGVVAMTVDTWRDATAHQWLGDGALLLAALCWAVYGMLAQRWAVAPLHAAAIVATGSLLCFAPLYLMLSPASLVLIPWKDVVFQGVFQGVLLGVVSIALYTRAVVSLGAQRTAFFIAAVPCITTVAGLWVLGEHPSAAAWVGVMALTGGMVAALGVGHNAGKA